MTTSQFAGIFSVIFLLAAIPLIVVQPFGGATAGLNSGFAAALASPFYLLLLLLIGFSGNFLGNGAAIKLPVGFLLMHFVAGVISLQVEASPVMLNYVLLAILLFGFVVCQLVDRQSGVKRYMLSVTLTSVIAFHYGRTFVRQMPQIAAPGFYILSLLIIATFLLGMGVAAGMVLSGEARRLMARMTDREGYRRLRAYVGKWGL